MNLRQRLLLYCDTHNLDVEEVLPVVKMCLDEAYERVEEDVGGCSGTKYCVTYVWEEIKSASSMVNAP